LKHELDNVQQKALCDVREWLRILHSVQELVSAEKTPTLSVVLPLYEHPILFSAEKLDEYMGYSRQSHIYTIAMSEKTWLNTFSSAIDTLSVQSSTQQ
jgi:hypothetical protein